MSKLRDMREKRKETAKRYTLDEVAKAIGVPLATLYYWEDHPSAVGRKQIKKLARYYGCKVEDIDDDE